MSSTVTDINAEALKKTLACKQLPTLPTVAMEILELTRDANVALAEIARCVELDQALAAKILKTVNSSFYGLSTPCPTISRAINYLGVNTVRSLVLGFSLVDRFGSPEGADGFDLVAHWRRAVYGAVAARMAAKNFGNCDPDEAFLGLLLRDLGSLAAAIALDDEYAAVLERSGGVHLELGRMETETLGVDHAEIGAQLAETWRVPDAIVEMIRRHHAPSLKETDPALVRCAAFASLAADILSDQPENRALAMKRIKRFLPAAQTRSEFELDAFLIGLKERSLELSRLFNIDTGAAPDVSGILEEAEQQKIRIQVEQDRTAQELRDTNDELSRQRFLDGLTGAQNRAAFDLALHSMYADACKPGGSLAVAFLDADKFKSVNDTHGHQAGDAVLIELARRLRETVAEAAHAYRYGGEEFAVLFPGANVADAVGLAENIRRAMDQREFDLTEVSDVDLKLRVTVSIGVAVLDDKTRAKFADDAALLRAADEAVYQAKQEGRNRTCLHQSGDETPADEPAPGPRLRVLIVEDDPLHQKLLVTAFEKTGSVEVRTVPSVSEAVKLLHFGENGTPYRPGLVLTDLNMPEHTGEKLVHYVRKTAALSMLPVLVLSASEDDVDVRRCLAAGASAYVPKGAFSEHPFETAKKIVAFWSLTRRAVA